MSGLAGLGTLAATGTTALNEGEDSAVVHQQDDEIEDDTTVHPVFGFAAESVDVDPPVDPDHEVSLLERNRETGLDAFPERYFEPTGLSIEPGETVQFRLESSTHTVTAYHPEVGYEQRVPDDSGPISSPLLWQGSYFLYTFEEPGVYDLGCLVHGWAGTVCRVVVGEASGPGATEVPEPAYRNSHPDPADPGPPDWLAAAVFRDSALDPEAILDQGTVGWDDLDPESTAFPTRLLTPPHAGRSLLAALSGDPAGVETAASGSVHLTPVENGLLWHLVLEETECVTQVHVHEGRRGEDGPVVAPMVTYTEEADGTGEGDPVSTTPDEPIVEGGVIDDIELVDAILDDPGAYYVSVHTTHNPDGAIRGQLRGGHPDDIVEREPEPAEFTVSNLNPEDVTVEQGDLVSVSATVSNEGDIPATQTVEFRIDGVTEAEQELELGCRESTTVTFEDIETADLEPGEYEHSIAADDEVFGTLSVVEDDDVTDPVADDPPDDEPPDDDPDDEPDDEPPDDDPDDEPDDEPPDDGPAEFVVSGLDPETLVVDPFEEFTVSATIENVGGEAGTQTVELRVGDDVVASQERELDAGQSETVTFEDVDAGYRIRRERVRDIHRRQ